VTPQRIQRKRTKGWQMPDGAIYVGRPTIYGNPFTVTKVGSCHVSPLLASQWRNDPHWHTIWPDDAHWCFKTKADAASRAVELYRYTLNAFEPDADFWQGIKGHDLACWCPLDQPCHADILLEIANAPQEDA
jgi:hypothetical protein